jgi:predicted nucleotidyltransferase
VKLNFNPERLGLFCRERGITRLELFGSALGENLRDESDVDWLATLRTDAHPTLLD